jgi:elongator complex protein 1
VLKFCSPSGPLLASVAPLFGTQHVVFFERNGLRHGEFNLRSAACEVVGMDWNADSDILALNVRDQVRSLR